MTITRILPALAVAGVLLAGCAVGPGDAPTDPGMNADGAGLDVTAPIPAPGPVAGQGTVLQKKGEDPQFCMGPIAESYPPQCSGVALAGWDWDAVDGEESSGDVTWGAYAITGTWDGTTLTATDSIMLALYDPMPFTDPLLDPENTGDTDQATLDEIQNGLDKLPFTFYEAHSENGYLFVTVTYDDGRIQDYMDATYLPDAVAVRSALKDVS